MSYDVLPDRCYDCGGLRRPSAFEQAICRCGKRTYAGRFYGAAPKDEAEPELPTAGMPQPVSSRAVAREFVVRSALRGAT